MRACVVRYTILLVLCVGCRPPDVAYQTAPAAPDLAVYGGGLFFQSADGLRNYSEVAIIPGRLRESAYIVLPDGELCEVSRLNSSLLTEHNVQHSITRDDGKGNFWLRVSGAMGVSFRSNRPKWIQLYSSFGESSSISLRYNGKTIAVPIDRMELEKLIGKPDETLLDTMPPDE